MRHNKRCTVDCSKCFWGDKCPEYGDSKCQDYYPVDEDETSDDCERRGNATNTEDDD